jgi:hypothetical protein
MAIIALMTETASGTVLVGCANLTKGTVIQDVIGHLQILMTRSSIFSTHVGVRGLEEVV